MLLKSIIIKIVWIIFIIVMINIILVQKRLRRLEQEKQAAQWYWCDGICIYCDICDQCPIRDMKRREVDEL